MPSRKISSFITGWTIDLSKLPKYSKFDALFVQRLDIKLIDLMIASTDVFDSERLKKLIDFKSKMSGSTSIFKHYRPHGIGRYHSSDSKSVATLPKEFKHTIMKFAGWTDIDMVAAHPTLACEMARLNNQTFPTILEYLNNRPAILQLIIEEYSVEGQPPLDRDEVKKYFNITAYGGGFKTWLYDEKEGIGEHRVCKLTPNAFMTRYKLECQQIMETIYASNQAIADKLTTDCEMDRAHKDYLWTIKKKVASYFYCILENELLYQLNNFLISKDLINAAMDELEFDGGSFKPLREITDKESFINELNAKIFKDNRIRMKFVFKEYDCAVDSIIQQRMELPDSDTVEDTDSDTDSESDSNTDRSQPAAFVRPYEEVKSEFELTHFKVINLSQFFKVSYQDGIVNKVIPFLKGSLKVSYEHIRCTIVNKLGKEIETKFINQWVEDATIRCYQDVDIFPPPLSCPENIFNLWTPFRIQQLYDSIQIAPEEEELVGQAVDLIKNHIRILSDNHQETYEYLSRWLGQLLAFPAYKTSAPCLISDEGCGKGTLIRIMRRLLGDSKVYETSSPERDVWGTFNVQMSHSYLVILDELEQKQFDNAIGKSKNLITADSITINGKGLQPYEIRTYHRFMSTTNTDVPIRTKNGDRRNVVIRCSDELKNNSEYFTKLNEILLDDRVIKRLYDWLVSLDGLEDFHKTPTIVTTYQEILQESNSSIFDYFLEYYTRRFQDETEVFTYSRDLYNQFNEWKNANGFVYDANVVKFMRNFKIYCKTSKLEDIIILKRKESGNGNVFNIDELKKIYLTNEE